MEKKMLPHFTEEESEELETFTFKLFKVSALQFNCMSTCSWITRKDKEEQVVGLLLLSDL